MADILGKTALRKISNREYKDAIKILTEAIAKFPDDKRLFVNRCFCYLSTKDLFGARSDAEYLTIQFPEFSNGWFLYGEVAMQLGRFHEAEKYYAFALDHNPNNVDAKERLFEAQMEQLLPKNYEPTLARKALMLTGNVQDALQYLNHGLVIDEPCEITLPEILTSAEITHLARELEKVGIKTEVARKVKIARPGAAKAPAKSLLDDARNQIKCRTIWIGNITTKATKQRLETLFKKCGAIDSISVMHEKRCAFINFKKPESASMALGQYQGLPFDNEHLLIRFPDNALKPK